MNKGNNSGGRGEGACYRNIYYVNQQDLITGFVQKDREDYRIGPRFWLENIMKPPTEREKHEKEFGRKDEAIHWYVLRLR